MGTHPIFESDFDCLTVFRGNFKMSRLICGSFNKIHVVSRTMVLSSRILSAAPQLDDAPRVASDKVLGLVDEIANLTLQEVADLNTELKKRLNISDVQYAAAPMAVAAAPAAAPAAEPAAEPEVEEVKVQTEFSLTMTGFDESKKVKVIKAIKANMDGMNLVAAKKFIEAFPGSIRKDVPKDEAEQVKAALEAEGAVITMK